MRNILTRRPKPKPKSQAPAPQSQPGASQSSIDLPEIFHPGRKVKKEEIRALAELIRKRYGLDLEIWSFRDAPERDRPYITDKMRRSDATLVKIRATIRSWDRPDIFESNADWRRFEEIKWRLMAGEKRVWAKNPPWMDKET